MHATITRALHNEVSSAPEASSPPATQPHPNRMPFSTRLSTSSILSSIVASDDEFKHHILTEQALPDPVTRTRHHGIDAPQPAALTK
jgi:hypothetical protein